MYKISFITSCFNSENFIDGLIENLLQQHHEDFELIIVDSASTDNSVEQIQFWSEKDPRVRLVQQEERTPYGVSWLVGWQNATGDIITNSNTDDRSYQWRGTKIAEAYNRRRITRDVKPHAFYYGGYETRIDGVPIAKGLPPPYSVDDMSQFFRCGVHIHWDNELRCAVNWNKMYRAAYEYKSAFDYWLVLYFMSLGAEGVAIPSCFSIYNQRKDSLEQGDKERNTFESIRAIEEFYPDGICTTNMHTLTKRDSPEFYQRYLDFKKQYR